MLHRLLVVSTLAIGAVSAQNAAPNWVGPKMGKPIDTACYRKSYITKNKQCAPGYEFDKISTCWAECPLEYPVECGMECIPQNADCTKEVLVKVSSVATVALNAATSGVFGQLSSASKGIQTGIKCGQQLFDVVSKISAFVDEVETSGTVDTTKDQLLFLLGKSNFVIYDLPVAVTTCLGLPTPTGLDQAAEVVDVVKKVLDGVLTSKKVSGNDFLKPDNFINFSSSVGLGATVSSLSPTDKDFLKSLVGGGLTCGKKVKNLIDKVADAAKDFKSNHPTSTVDVLKFAILKSDLILKDLPEATTQCWNAAGPDGFKTRDDIVKTIHVIIDRILDSASQNGNPVPIDKYAIVVANMGLEAISLFDPTGIANMAKEFVQPICGPTAFIGDIADGPADVALGLRTIQKAFRNSTGSWTRKGDGLLHITFKSVDDKDVTVNIKSGGDVNTQVKVPKGQTITWSKPLSELQGKTLYLDRWRPGFLGIPGTGGGSLLLWVPAGGEGALVLDVPINPTSFSDKNRLLRREERPE